MFSFFKKSEEDVVAVFDIGNGSIGAALVKLTKDKPPHILYTHREPLTFLPHVTSSRLLDNMLRLMRVVAHRVQQEGLPKLKSLNEHFSIKHAHCVFSSPWYVSQSRVVKLQQDKPFVITQNIIDEMLKKEQDQFIGALREGKYEQVFGPDTRLLEKKIIHSKLNGYEVNVPVGKKAKELELTFFSSFISNNIIQSVESTLSHFFRFNSIQYHSYALTAWSAVRDMYPNTPDFLFLDITGEVTDAMLTEGGVLSETVSFPLGRNMILRKLVDSLTVPPEVAVSFLSLFSQGTTDKDFGEKMKMVLKGSQQFWIAALIKTLKSLKEAHLLPHAVFVTADNDVVKIFEEALMQPFPPEMEIPQNVFDVTILTSENVKPLATFAPGAQRDSFLSIECEFLNKITFGIV